jgi:membrane associated rhomboid family serine protease
MIERHYGTRRFLHFYFLCAIFAGLVYTAFQYVVQTRTFSIGASGSIMGVLMLTACLYPNNTVYFELLFPMRLRTMIWILIALNVYIALITPVGGAAATAHLGGLLFGYLYYRFGGRVVEYLERMEDRWHEKYQQEQPKEQENLREEVDRLLDKIAHQGLHSLTTKEREFLQKASKEYQRDV